jgi:hypothetical protein
MTQRTIRGTLIIVATGAILFIIVSVWMRYTGYRLPETSYIVDGYVPVMGHQIVPPIQSFLLNTKVMLVSVLLSMLCFTGLYELNK